MIRFNYKILFGFLGLCLVTKMDVWAAAAQRFGAVETANGMEVAVATDGEINKCAFCGSSVEKDCAISSGLLQDLFAHVNCLKNGFSALGMNLGLEWKLPSNVQDVRLVVLQETPCMCCGKEMKNINKMVSNCMHTKTIHVNCFSNHDHKRVCPECEDVVGWELLEA